MRVFGWIVAGFLGILAVITLATAITWYATGGQYLIIRFWAPRMAAVERQIFVQTPSYVQGMQQELDSYHLDYLKAQSKGDTGHMDAIADIVLHRADEIDNSLLSDDLQSWIQHLKAEREAKAMGSETKTSTTGY